MYYTILHLKFANESPESLCAIELIEMHNKHILEQKSWLIRPDTLSISPICQSRYGIQLSDFIDAPSLTEVWDDILPYLQNKVLFSHKSIWIISMLLKVLNYYQLDYPKCQIGCTLIMSKRIYPLCTGHSLDKLKEYLGYSPSSKQSASDAMFIVALIRALMQSQNVFTMYDLLESLQLQLGEIPTNGSLPIIWPTFNGSLKSHSKATTESPSDSDLIASSNGLIPTTLHYDFTDKVICLTGALESMVRVDAVKRLHALGATYTSSVNCKTNAILTNVKNPELLPLDTLSSKLRRALLLKAQGQAIDIIDEETLLNAWSHFNHK